MEDVTRPRQFSEWRTDKFEREEDAAYTFGSHLIRYCRDEVMQNITQDTSAAEKEKIKEAVHNSLHNVMDMLEGFWRLDSGEEHSVEYVLQVVVKDKSQKEVERLEISPCRQDLPIGFWKWTEDGEFR